MKYVRIYADERGESHFEDVDVAAPPSGSADLSDMLPATGAFFRRGAPDAVRDWHNAPRRQLVIALSGQFEVEASDGEVRRFGPGEILLADDTTGKGHITRTVGGQERHMLFVPLAD